MITTTIKHENLKQFHRYKTLKNYR